jgi:transposase
MNRNNNQIREIFLRMQKAGKSVIEIAQTLGVKRQTIYNWKALKEEELLKEPSKTTRETKLDLVKFKEYLEKNPFAFHREVAEVFGMKKSAAHKWRKKLGLTRKKAKTTYKESDEELKKSSDKN